MDSVSCVGNIKYNRYDFGVIFLISIVVFGNLGSPLYPSRLVAIMFSPVVLRDIFKGNVWIPKYVKNFFLVWIFIGVFSVLWSYNRGDGVKAIFYHFCNIIDFFALYLFALKANKPLRSILLGWIILFMLTVPIALYEFVMDVHFSNASLQNENSVILLANGLKVQRKFAAVTYGNMNTYNVIIGYCLVYILTSFFVFSKKKMQLFLWTLLLLAMYIIIMNASRGAFLCFVIAMMIFIPNLFKQRMVSKLFVFIILLFVMCFIYNYIDTFVGQILGRLAEQGLEDNSRMDIYGRGLVALFNTAGFGVGIGGVEEALKRLAPNSLAAMHNMYLEFLVQFGIIPALFYFRFIFKTYKNLYVSNVMYARFLAILLFSILIPLFLINSGYLTFSEMWLFLSSAFTIMVLVNKNKIVVA